MLRKISSILFLLIFTTCIQLFSAEYDNQAWLCVSVCKNFTSSKLTAAYEAKYGHDLNDLVIRLTSLSYYRKYTSHVAVDVSVKQIAFFKNSIETDWYIPYANFYYYFNLGDFKFDNRARVEFWTNTNEANFFRYRNYFRCRLGKPIFLNFTPYIADEPFWDFNSKVFRQNRAYIGVTNKLNDYLNLQLFFCLQSNDLQPGWSHYRVAGLYLTTTF